ncbi:MAG: four helix bundle protein [Candidatus Sulfotelmatobacter sp.]
MSHSYRDLVVWQRAITMVTEVYRATQLFPREETYGLTSQLRRSAVSVASNIAEGQGRISKPEFRQFLGIARGSLLEMETQILIAANLGYLSQDARDHLAACSGEVSRLLHGLMQSLQPREISRKAGN